MVWVVDCYEREVGWRSVEERVQACWKMRNIICLSAKDQNIMDVYNNLASPWLEGTSKGLDGQHAVCQQNLKFWFSYVFISVSENLRMEPTLVCPAERRQRVPGWARLSHKLKRSSENGGGHLHVRPSVAPGKWSIHLQNMPLHCIYPSSSPSPSSPVPKSREWVSAISGVEVTPSRDRVFSTRILTFEIISQKWNNFEKHFSYIIFGLRLVPKT